MDYYLAQIILAARDTKEWMNILFVVVIALFYIVGTLVKAKTKKFGDKGFQKGKQPGQRPAIKPLERQKTPWQTLKDSFNEAVEQIREQSAQSPQRPQTTAQKPVRPEPTIQKVAAKTAYQVGIPASQARKGPKLSPLAPHIQPEFKKIPEIPSETFKKLGEKPASRPVEIPTEKYLSGVLSDYASSESLRRAILHYEILGKPVSLRDPTERFTGR